MNQEINWPRISAIAFLIISIVLVIKIIQTFLSPNAVEQTVVSGPEVNSTSEQKADNSVSEQLLQDEEYIDNSNVIRRQNRKYHPAVNSRSRIVREGNIQHRTATPKMAENAGTSHKDRSPSDRWLYRYYQD